MEHIPNNTLKRFKKFQKELISLEIYLGQEEIYKNKIGEEIIKQDIQKVKRKIELMLKLFPSIAKKSRIVDAENSVSNMSIAKDERTCFEKQEDAWFENDCQGRIEDY
jgi:hypothetical protein